MKDLQTRKDVLSKAIKNRTTKPQIEMFAIEYALRKRKTMIKEWAQEFNVATSTIAGWLANDKVIERIAYYIKDYMQTLKEAGKRMGIIGLRGLVQISRDENIDGETRRKACYNIIGLAGLQDVNKTGNVNILQQQAQKTGVERLTNEELNSELVKLEQIE